MRKNGIWLPLIALMILTYVAGQASWQKAQARAKLRAEQKAECRVTLQKIELVLFDIANRNPSPASLAALEPHYLEKVPNCPAHGRPYTYEGHGQNYTLICEADHNVYNYREGWLK